MELKPCPFCGKKDTLEVITGAEFMDEDQEFYQHSESFAVVCDAATPNGKGGCGAMGGFADTMEAAIYRWNTRSDATAKASIAQQAEQLAAAQKVIELCKGALACKYDSDLRAEIKAAIAAAQITPDTKG